MQSQRTIIAFLLAAVAVLTGPSCSADEQAPTPFNPRRHMGIDEIKPGMTGYGLSVFQGTTIETFDVEVLSVEHGRRPGKSVIWVRCTDERMQKLGPVRGMSGSPIFLWPDGAATRKPGEGGRMIGAFAYGFPMGKDCMVGVQPIVQMLEAGDRAEMPTDGQANDQTGARGHAADRLIQAAQHSALTNGIHADRLWRLKMMRRMLGTHTDNATDNPVPAMESSITRPSVDVMQPMLLPVRIGSTQLAQRMAPMLRTLGLAAVGGSGGGRAPRWIDPAKVKYQPGGVLAVPIVQGDVNMAAIGTITEVLDDGTILAFGHAMRGQGKLNVPIAPGFVHYVQPSLNASFKLGGALPARGALVNDEVAAVVGKPTAKAKLVPSTVQVVWPDPTKTHRFNYRMADDRVYLPTAAAFTLSASLAADTAPPIESTVIVRSTLQFEGDRTIEYRGMDSSGGMMAMSELPGFVSVMGDNPYQRVKLRSIKSRVEVVEQVRLSMIENVHLTRQRYQPGQTIAVSVDLKPFRGRTQTKKIAIALPPDLPEGEYPLVIGGAPTYVQAYQEAHPEVAHIESVDDLYQALRWMNSIKDDALYAVMALPNRPGLRIGRTTLPRMPGSRGALMKNPTDTQVAAFVETLESRVDLDHVVMGVWQGKIEVRRDPNKTDTD